MNLLYMLDEFLTKGLTEGYSEAQIAELLLDEDCVLQGPDDNVVLLSEAVRRVRIKRGGVNVTVRKTGRPNPMRSQRAKMSARRNSAKRKAAAKRFARSPKAKQMRRVMSTIRRSKARTARPKIRRPKVRRPVMRRPKISRPKVRRPAVRRHGPPRRTYRRR
jgi:hypothetical protein